MRIVVDLGNTRVKWGRCTPVAVAEMVALPLYELAPWQQQLAAWADGTPCKWVLAASNPLALERFIAWLTVTDQRYRVLAQPQDFPVHLAIEHPETVGKDRLANALAFRELRQKRRPQAGILVSAGSAITIDLLDEAGVFQGGAILPGLTMMAEALNYYTTRLPLVELPAKLPQGPGKHTVAALQSGISAGAVGAVGRLRADYARLTTSMPALMLTGGDAAWLHQAFPDAEVWPEMTLEGLRLAAAAPQ